MRDRPSLPPAPAPSAQAVPAPPPPGAPPAQPPGMAAGRAVAKPRPTDPPAPVKDARVDSKGTSAPAMGKRTDGTDKRANRRRATDRRNRR
jgi:hypothetical protein